jgi:hypothetical protein
MPSPRSVVVSTAAWTIGALSSVGIGLVALSMIGTGFADRGQQPLAPSAVGSSAPADSESPFGFDTPSAQPTPSVTPAGTNHTVTTRGGTVIVRCVQSGAYMVGWSPAAGYQADDLRRGPAVTVGITFESTTREVSVSVICEANTAQPTIHDEAKSPLDH